jgi:hypothetical protein
MKTLQLGSIKHGTKGSVVRISIEFVNVNDQNYPEKSGLMGCLHLTDRPDSEQGTSETFCADPNG